VIGWCTDLFRLFWGLLYWNTRKAWFRARRGRSACPCQSLSDSGRAYETQCEACTSWHRPWRFRRVCPLLVQTKDGLRCSANTADVRPFWRRTGAYYGGSALALYSIGVLGVFIFLRTVGYPVSIIHVGLPPLWHKVGQARGWFFLERSNRAFLEGRTGEGLLYLANSYEFDPTNFAAGLSLAKHFQVGQPGRSDEVFARLMRDHPDQQNVTAQEWFRALLARGNFKKINELAREQILSDTKHAAVWVRVLLVSTRQAADSAPLHALVADPAPAAPIWRPLFETELLVRSGRPDAAKARLMQAWPLDERTRFTLFYRVNALIDLGDTFAALDLLNSHLGVLDDEADITLRLSAFAVAGSSKGLREQVDKLLGRRLTPANLSIGKILCAQLIRHPDAEIFDRLWQKVEREQMPLTTETVGLWFSLMCAAGAVDDRARLHELTGRLKQASKTPFHALNIVEAFFRGETPERRINYLLPILPLPLEVTYALLERYGQAAPVPAVPAKRA
jgi:hypothetical protein